MLGILVLALFAECECEEVVEYYCRLVCLHVSGVAKVNARLGSTLVGSVLQGDDILAGTELLIAEVANILVRLLGSNRWLVEV